MTVRHALVAAALLLAPSAFAQGPTGPEPRPASSPQGQAARVEELSRVLGRAHYLRVLCNGQGDQTWRNAMMGLLNVEAQPGAARRSALAGIFNEGYRIEEERFASCSPEARESNRALSAQGKRLADELAARFEP